MASKQIIEDEESGLPYDLSPAAEWGIGEILA